MLLFWTDLVLIRLKFEKINVILIFYSDKIVKIDTLVPKISCLFVYKV